MSDDDDDLVEGHDDGLPVRIFCKGRCRVTREHRLTKLPHGRAGQDPAKRWYGYQATCERCGNIATDHYNWGGGLSARGMREQDARMRAAEKARRG